MYIEHAGGLQEAFTVCSVTSLTLNIEGNKLAFFKLCKGCDDGVDTFPFPKVDPVPMAILCLQIPTNET